MSGARVIVRFGFAPRAAGLSIEDAQAHWRSTHGDLAAGLPGLRRYNQQHQVLRGGRPLLPHPGFDVLAETEFDSVAAMEAAFASPLYRAQISADELELIRRDRFGFAICERLVRVGGDPGEPQAKLITLLRLQPGRSREEFLEAFTGPYAEVVARSRPLRHEQLIPVPGPDHAFDAADEIWFPDPDAALAYVNSGAADAAALELGGLVLGRERLIVEPRLVVGPRLPA